MAGKKSRKKGAPQPAPISRKSRRWLGPALLVLVVAVALAAALPGLLEPKPPTDYTFVKVGRFPHDPNAYTQGLVFHNGYIYESTGLYGQSSVRKLDLNSGAVLNRRDLDSRYFGEGLTYFQGVLMQVTWRERRGFVYDIETLEPLREFSYANEGWGLTDDGEQLIMSDGSAKLYFRDPSRFTMNKTLTVKDGNQPVDRLNELEYIEGEVWANVYQTDQILRISPETGQVVGRIDLHGILGADDRRGGEDVLNGIAYDAEHRRIFVTGKHYHFLYEIEIKPKKP